MTRRAVRIFLEMHVRLRGTIPVGFCVTRRSLNQALAVAQVKKECPVGSGSWEEQGEITGSFYPRTCWSVSLSHCHQMWGLLWNSFYPSARNDTLAPITLFLAVDKPSFFNTGALL